MRHGYKAGSVGQGVHSAPLYWPYGQGCNSKGVPTSLIYCAGCVLFKHEFSLCLYLQSWVFVHNCESVAFKVVSLPLEVKLKSQAGVLR